MPRLPWFARVCIWGGAAAICLACPCPAAEQEEAGVEAAEAQERAGADAERHADERAEALERAHQQQVRQRQLTMRKALMRKVSFQFVDTPLVEAVGFFQTLAKVNIVVSRDLLAAEDEPVEISLKLTDVTLGQALRTLARQSGLRISFEGGVVFFDWAPDPDELAETKVGEITVRRGGVTLRLDVFLGDLEEGMRRDLIRQGVGRLDRRAEGDQEAGRDGGDMAEREAWQRVMRGWRDRMRRARGGGGRRQREGRDRPRRDDDEEQAKPRGDEEF